jgi:hypothetical protein
LQLLIDGLLSLLLVAVIYGGPVCILWEILTDVIRGRRK